MLKLIKYELRKQLFSKFAILFILGLLEVWFLFDLFVTKETENFGMKAPIFLMIFSFISILYVSFECIFTFSNDLKTKQSYMLFMVPQSTYSIMGAKVISAMLQIVFTSLVFGIVAAADITAVFAKYGELEELLEALREMLRRFFSLEIDVGKIVILLAAMVISWCSVIVMAMFSITLSATFMANTRIKGVVSFLIFIAFNVLVSKIGSPIAGSIMIGNTMRSEYMDYTWSILFYLAVTIVLYLGTAWMLEKKVSV